MCSSAGRWRRWCSPDASPPGPAAVLKHTSSIRGKCLALWESRRGDSSGDAVQSLAGGSQLCRSRSSSAQWGQALGRVVQGALAKLPRSTAGRHVSETHASGFYEGSVHNAFVKAKQIRSNFNLATIDFFFRQHTEQVLNLI